MAIRPVFISTKGESEELILRKEINFEWFPGFSVSQKQKSIFSLHKQIEKEDSKYNVLEISSKSPNELGVKLSAFNLMINTKNDKKFSVESGFQASKVFSNGGPFVDLFLKNSKEAKKDSRLRNSGKLIGFKYLNREFPLEPKTFFYNWLYINALNMNPDLAKEILKYDSFTDIEFNPQKSINCQAEAAALYLSLKNRNKLEISLESIESFKENAYPDYFKKEEIDEKYEQLNFFDF